METPVVDGVRLGPQFLWIVVAVPTVTFGASHYMLTTWAYVVK